MKTKLLLIFLISFKIAAQDKIPKVTIDDVRATVCAADTSAPAEILYKKSEVTIQGTSSGWQRRNEVFVRIKVYKKDGYRFANFEKEYYAGPHPDNVIFSDEATYNLVGGKIEKTKMKSESEFSQRESKYHRSKKISLPNVREGSIIEYRFVHISNNVSMLEDFFLQYDIPVRQIRYSVQAPEYFTYNKMVGGYLTPVMSEVNIRVEGSYDETKTYFQMDNVPAMVEEEYVDNMDNYRARILYEISSYKTQTVQEDFATNWTAVAKKIYEDEDFGPQLRKDNYFEEDLTVLLSGKSSNHEKMAAIFTFVQNKMTWNEYNGYSCHDGVKAAYKASTGNTAEINLMLVAMLRHAGLEANPVLVSTRKHGVAIFPSRAAFNYVVASVMIDGQQVLLDATSKNARPNILPHRALNWTGRLIRKDGTSEEVELTPKNNSKDVMTAMADLAPDGKITGKIRGNYSDYNAYGFRERYSGLSRDTYLEKLEKKHTGLTVDDYKIENETDFVNPVVETFAFTLESGAEAIGDKLYLTPMMFFAAKENPFKLEKREYPINFVYPHQEKYSFTFTIPDGYVAESIPVSQTIVMDHNIASFKYNVSVVGQKIQFLAVEDINLAVVAQQYYGLLKDFYKEVITKQNEKIVLKKI